LLSAYPATAGAEVFSMIDSGTLEENGVVEVKFMTALIDERNMMGGFSTECALYAARFTMPARVGSNDYKGRLKSTLQALWMIRETVCWRFLYGWHES